MDFTGKTIVYQNFSLGTTGSGWFLKEQFIVIVGTAYKLACPSLMETDGASIPRFFWRLMGPPMDSKYVMAAVIHDAGYMDELEWAYKEDGEWVIEDHTRKEVDQLFLALMKDLRVPWWRRRLMYLAVRWFGGSHWTER